MDNSISVPIPAIILLVTMVGFPVIYLAFTSVRARKILLSKRYYAAMVLSLCALGGGIVWAATQLAWNNSSTIIAGQDIFITQPTFTAFTGCPADGDAQYINTGISSLSWTFAQGGTAQLAYFCIDNKGSSTDSTSVTSTLISGICPATSSNLVFQAPTGVPNTLQPHTTTTSPVTIGVCAGSNAPAGAGPTFTITVK